MNKNKSSFAAVIFFVVSMTLGFISMTTEAKAGIFGHAAASFVDLSSQLQTPDSIAKYMWRNFSYVDDEKLFGKEEYWQSPQEFYSNKKGDCEDFAIFAKSLLNANGVESFLLNVYGKNFGHTVCVYKENGKYNVIDGTKVHRYQAESVEEVSSKIHSRWTKSMIVEPAIGTGRGQVLQSFEKRMKAQKSLSTFA